MCGSLGFQDVINEGEMMCVYPLTSLTFYCAGSK